MQMLRGAKTATTTIKKEQASRGSETISASQPSADRLYPLYGINWVNILAF
jgi:hypothetical protein